MCLVFETGKGAIEALHYCKIYWHVLLFLDCSVTRNNFCVPCSISPLASTRTFNNTVEGTLRPITRLQNGRIFCERERRIIFERKAGASEKTARENGERRLTRLRACEARALHTRGSRLRRFPPSENVRKRLFCSLLCWDYAPVNVPPPPGWIEHTHEVWHKFASPGVGI